MFRSIDQKRRESALTDNETAVHFDDLDAETAITTYADQNKILFCLLEGLGARYAVIRHVIKRADPKGHP